MYFTFLTHDFKIWYQIILVEDLCLLYYSRPNKDWLHPWSDWQKLTEVGHVRLADDELGKIIFISDEKSRGVDIK